MGGEDIMRRGGRWQRRWEARRCAAAKLFFAAAQISSFIVIWIAYDIELVVLDCSAALGCGDQVPESLATA
jgi:hypothetical protein